MRELLRRHLEAEQADPAGGGSGGWHAKEPGVYHASANNVCHRAAWYARAGHPKDPGPLGLFKVGHLVEEVAHDAMRRHYGPERMVTQVECHETLPCGVTIKGRTDSCVLAEGFESSPNAVGYTEDDLHGKVELVTDSKSSSAGEGAKTKANQASQVCWYADRLGCQEARIFHPGRNDILKMPDKDTIFGPEEIRRNANALRDYFTRQYTYDQSDEVPPCTPFTSTECDWCPFLAQCKRDGGPSRWKA